MVEPDLLDRVLNSPDPRARAAAVRVAQDWLAKIPDPFGRLAARVVDEHPRVRLEAVRALGHAPESRAAEVALRALDRPVDKFLDYALWLTLRDLEPYWMPALRAGRFDYGGDARRLVFALNAVGSTGVVRPLVDALRAGQVGPADEDRVRALVATLGEPADLAFILDAALLDATPGPRKGPLLEALAQAARARKVIPSGDLARVAPLLDSPDAPTRAAAARAVGLWKVEALRGRLEALARSNETPEMPRQAAIDGLASLGGGSRDLLAVLAGPPYPSNVRMEAAAALVALDPKLAAERAVIALGEAGDADLSGLFEAFVDRKGGPAALASALEGKSLPPEVARSGIRIASLSGRADSALVAALDRAGGGSTGPRAWTPSERASLLAEVSRKGDPARGEAVFRRERSQCLKCHAVAGAGGRVGPGLESIGASAPIDYLLDSLVEPAKAVKEGYHATVVATTDGRVLTGLKVRQTESELVLRDAEDREVIIPLDAVEEQKPAGSLMPAGLTDAMTRGEVVDLVRFLSELGKLGPYAVSPQSRFVRRWQVLEPPASAPPVRPRRPARRPGDRPEARLDLGLLRGLRHPARRRPGDDPLPGLGRPGRPGPRPGRGEHARQGPPPPGPRPDRLLARRPPGGRPPDGRPRFGRRPPRPHLRPARRSPRARLPGRVAGRAGVAGAGPGGGGEVTEGRPDQPHSTIARRMPMIFGRSSMKYSSTSSETRSPRSLRNFQAAPVLTTPWMRVSGRPERSWLILAATIAAMHWPRPVRIRSFFASTMAMKGPWRMCWLGPRPMMKSQ